MIATRTNLSFALTIALVMMFSGDSSAGAGAQAEPRPQLSVRPVEDFAVTGTGDHASWQRAEWTTMRRRQADGHPYETRFKMLY